MRDHTKLEAFQSAHQVVLEMYRLTGDFPASEQYGLVSQLRRGAVSVASNIVEGAARSSLNDYLRFLDIAYASAKELRYQWLLSRDLELVNSAQWRELEPTLESTVKILAGLIKSLRTRKSA